MGSIFSKICCREKAKKLDEKQPHIRQPVEEESDVRVVTNLGGTIDKSTDSKEPQDTPVKKKVKPVDIASITIDEKSTSIPEPIQKDNKINDEKQKKKEKRKKKKIMDSSSDSTSSSSSDSDSHIEKKYKRKNKDGSYTKVYSKTTFSAGTKINIVKGNNITINDNKTIIKNNPPKRTKETPKLFAQMFTEQSARKFQTDPFNQTGPFVSDTGGSFIDLTKHNMVEDVRSRQILDKWTKSVGILKSPRGTCTCFRVGSKYIMTALHAIRLMIEPEFREIQNTVTDWRTDLRKLCQQDTFVDFEYLTEGEHIERNKFFFKLDETNSVPFYDESTDSMVLELECDQNRQLPPPFKKFGLPMLNHKFYLVHHTRGLPKKVEPVDKIVDVSSDRTRTDIQTLQNLSERFLNCNNRDVEQFRCERPPFSILGNRDRLLFHCVSNKGASGGPGIQVTNDDRVVVVTMLLWGYPDWYYSEQCQDIKSYWDKAQTVEQGASFASIFSEIQRMNPGLFQDIFGVRPSRTVQPVPPERHHGQHV